MMNSILTVQKAIDYIENHLREPLELQDIADRAFMSVPNLYRAFYSLTGHPIKEYIRKRRMSVASWHLRYSQQPVLDIAFQCGFDSYQAFTKMFKKLVGMTPGAYRKADLYYTFEAVNLFKNLSYMEEKEHSERYPGVKVINFRPMQVAVYRYQSSLREGIEEEAVRMVLTYLERLGWDLQRIRIFGYNTELPSKKEPYGYEIMIPLNETNMNLDTEEFLIGSFPGGLYAIGKSLETSGDKIIAEWDRLLSEWLPRSTFELGGHRYVEEFLTYQGTITRLKLYLPVTRKLEPDMIETMNVDPFTVFTCRGEGPNAQKDADHQMISKLLNNGMGGNSDLRLFMSYSYGVEPGEDFWYELGISFPVELEDEKEHDVWGQVNRLGGGLYAFLTTGAYGVMTGVLNKMHRWLYTNNEFTLDENRQWFAEYIPGNGSDIERSTWVRCYIPIINVADQYIE